MTWPAGETRWGADEPLPQAGGGLRVSLLLQGVRQPPQALFRPRWFASVQAARAPAAQEPTRTTSPSRMVEIADNAVGQRGSNVSKRLFDATKTTIPISLELRFC